MYTVKEDTTLVGVSELRTRLEKILKESKRHKIVIEKRNKPIAVLIAIEQYGIIEEIMDRLEDYELGKIAASRVRRSSKKDYISFEDALKRISR